MSCCCKLTEPQEVVVGALIYSLSVRSSGTTWLMTGKGRQGAATCKTEPLTWGISCYFQGISCYFHNVRIELNSQIRCWYPRIVWYCMGSPLIHTLKLGPRTQKSFFKILLIHLEREHLGGKRLRETERKNPQENPC